MLLFFFLRVYVPPFTAPPFAASLPLVFPCVLLIRLLFGDVVAAVDRVPPPARTRICPGARGVQRCADEVGGSRSDGPGLELPSLLLGGTEGRRFGFWGNTNLTSLAQRGRGGGGGFIVSMVLMSQELTTRVTEVYKVPAPPRLLRLQRCPTLPSWAHQFVARRVPSPGLSRSLPYNPPREDSWPTPITCGKLQNQTPIIRPGSYRLSTELR